MLLLLILSSLLGPAALAQGLPLESTASEAETSPTTEAEPDSRPEPANPREAMSWFLDALNQVKAGQPNQMDKALLTLDLSQVNPIVRQERGPILAWTLLEVIDRTRYVQLDQIPEEVQGDSWTFEQYPGLGSIRMRRQEDGRWLFDAATMAALPDILDSLEDRQSVIQDEDRSYLPWHLRFREQLPDSMRSEGFLLENWQWLAIGAIIFLGMLLDRLTALLLRLLIGHWQRTSRNPYYQEMAPDTLRPIGLMLLAFVWWAGISLIGLPEGAMLVLLITVKFVASISCVWAAYRLVDVLSGHLLMRAQATASKLDDALVPLIPRSLKIFVTVVGLLFIADNLNVDISSLLAGLGLGGLAFALAAKDMVQNLFGSITVLLDRTFSVGDWVIVAGVEGSVERIGFRSTRIRTFYNSVITVPNSKFITAEVDNMGERTWRRYKQKFAIAYATPPERVEAFCEGIRELVRCHPYMRKDYYHVYLNDFSDSSIDILIYVFWQTPDWGTELRERHRFLLDVLRLAAALGVEFAFPTRTLFMRSEDRDSELAPPAPVDQALQQGRELARGIVEQTTGLNQRPPPVQF